MKDAIEIAARRIAVSPESGRRAPSNREGYRKELVLLGDAAAMRSTKPHETALTGIWFRVISCEFVDRVSNGQKQFVYLNSHRIRAESVFSDSICRSFSNIVSQMEPNDRCH